MASKYNLITELYKRTAQTVVSSPLNWQQFLESACKNFKLRFDEQLLVFAQRPDATAVLPINGGNGASWNKTFGRWVNRGARGIAVFEDSDRSRQRLMYYFDISDTHEGRFARPVPIWEMKDEYEQEVIESLENSFGSLTNTNNLGAAILSAAENATEDNIPDYLHDLAYIIENNSESDLSSEDSENICKKLVTNSVAYMMMSRLGIKTSDFFGSHDFKEVVNFNTPETLNMLGFATSDIAEMGLSEIAKTVLALDRQNRIVAEKEKSNYNLGEEKTDERGFENENDGTDISNAGGLQPAESENAGTAGSTDRALRNDEEALSETTPQGDVLQSADSLQAERPSELYRADGDGDGRTDNTADGGSRGSDGNFETARHDDLDSEDERYKESGAGDSESGDNFRLEYYDRRHEDKSLPFFGNTEIINEMLRTTPHLKADKDEIIAFYEENPDNDVRTEYIKSIFNNEYTEVILEDGSRVGYKTYQNVLHLWQGSYLQRTAQSFYDWGVIAQHFNAMILLGELQNTVKPLPTVNDQISLVNDEQIKAGDENKSSAFTFS